MTIAGRLDQSRLPAQAELLPAKHAQSYIASLTSDLESLDGGPIHLVHDRETGTSDILVSELVDALLEQRDISSLPIGRVLEACFENAINFRIWLASNNPVAYKTHTTQASSMASVLAALKNGSGAWWHAKSAA